MALYWKNTDPRKFVNIVPTSAITGEGIPDLLQLMVKLTQTMMGDRLMFVDSTECTVLEVRAHTHSIRQAGRRAAALPRCPSRSASAHTHTRVCGERGLCCSRQDAIQDVAGAPRLLVRLISRVARRVPQVKTMEGLGTTVDCVLVNGKLREGDRIVVCGLGGPIVTRIKALKTPQVRRASARPPLTPGHPRKRASRGPGPRVCGGGHTTRLCGALCGAGAA